MFLAEGFDTLQPFEMAYRILGHCRPPFVDAREKWFGGESTADDLCQFIADNLQNFFFPALENLLVAYAAEKATDDGAIGGGAVGKFIVNEGGCEQAAAGNARDGKSKAPRKGRTHF